MSIGYGVGGGSFLKCIRPLADAGSTTPQAIFWVRVVLASRGGILQVSNLGTLSSGKGGEIEKANYPTFIIIPFLVILPFRSAAFRSLDWFGLSLLHSKAPQIFQTTTNIYV